jgi:hypothetical protein
MVAGSATQIVLDLTRAGDPFHGWWEPGLTGAAVGTFVLVIVSALARQAHQEDHA